MIAFIVGTTAEVIKVAPVQHALRRRGACVQTWFTGQHWTDVADVLEDTGLPTPERWLVPPDSWEHIARPGQVPGWIRRVARTVVAERPELRRSLAGDGGEGLVVVQGDTFSTVLGALTGRALGARVAHVEAGLRSGNILSPFPEELNRRVAGRLVDVHFAPTEREVANLRRARGVVVKTGANTVVDALRAAAREGEPSMNLPERFGLVTLHRFELLRRADHLAAVLRALAETGREMPLLMVAGAPERARMSQLGMLSLLDGRWFRLIPRMSYTNFLRVLVRAKFVVTDSGGLQEECALLGVPCAVHRQRTERHQALSENVLLTGMRVERLRNFLATAETYRRPSALDQHHPSQVIASTLQRLGYG